MSDQSGPRPNLRLIAGDLVSSIANDVEAVATEIVKTGRRGRISRPETSIDDVEVPAPHRTRIAVIGGGIAGLSAAWSLIKDREIDADVVVYEADAAVGGKVKLGQLEGVPIDTGAESMLAVRPEALALARSVGLAAAIVNPSTSQAAIVARGQLKPLPAGLISGIPTDLRALAVSEVLSVGGLLRIPMDHLLPRTTIDGDVSVGDFVATRLGREVVDRLVEPMLSGVYAGRADELSLDMVVPVLFRLAKRERSLLSAAKEARKTGAAPTGARRGPVFAGISGGVGRLPVAVADRLRRRGVAIETGTTVTGLRQAADGWRLLTNKAGKAEPVTVDAVILAVPAPAAAKLLRRANPAAASILDTIAYASVALTTFLYDTDSVPSTLAGSGFLVPPIERFAVKAATYSSRKWAWVARAGAGGAQGKGKRPGYVVIRASLGRYGEPGALQRDDDELAALAARELHTIAGLPADPLAFQVKRWGGALPQYTVGHRARVTEVREVLIDTPGLSVCGAAYDGVGIAACVGSARFAAGQIAAYVAERGQWVHG